MKQANHSWASIAKRLDRHTSPVYRQAHKLGLVPEATPRATPHERIIDLSVPSARRTRAFNSANRALAATITRREYLVTFESGSATEKSRERALALALEKRLAAGGEVRVWEAVPYKIRAVADAT